MSEIFTDSFIAKMVDIARADPTIDDGEITADELYELDKLENAPQIARLEKAKQEKESNERVSSRTGRLVELLSQEVERDEGVRPALTEKGALIFRAKVRQSMDGLTHEERERVKASTRITLLSR